VLGDPDRDPDWETALSAGLRVSAGFVLAALLLAALDLRAARAARRGESAERQPAAADPATVN
jgi:hypothetical protein